MHVMAPHLLTPFVIEKFVSLVSLKRFSAPWFYGNSNIQLLSYSTDAYLEFAPVWAKSCLLLIHKTGF